MAYELSISKKMNNEGRSELQLRLRLGKIDQQAATRIFVNPQHVRTEHYLSSRGRKSKRLVLSVSRTKTPEVEHTAKMRGCVEQLMEYVDSRISADGMDNISKGWLAMQIDSYYKAQEEALAEENKKEHKPRKPKAPSFFDIYNNFISSHEISLSRQRHLKVIYRTLMRFELYRQLLNPKFKLTLDGFDELLLHDLENYIRNEHELLLQFPMIIKQVPESRFPGQRGQNTINGFFKNTTNPF